MDPSLCKKCGRCCYVKLIIGDEIVYTPYPCPFLDEETRLCTIYEHRHRLNPDCLTIEEGIKLGVFPADCPYVKDIPNYRPPREEWTEEDLQELSEQAQKQSDN